MGAMLRFKRETGKDVSEVHGEVSDMVTLLWCCMMSASAADGVEVAEELRALEGFADHIDAKDMNQFARSLSEDAKKNGSGED